MCQAVGHSVAGAYGLQMHTTTFVSSPLSPLTDYWFRVFARNAGGDSAPSTALMVHTTPVELTGFSID